MRASYLSLTSVFCRTGDGLQVRWRWQAPDLLHAAHHSYGFSRERLLRMGCRQDPADPLAHGATVVPRHTEPPCRRGEGSLEAHVSIHTRLFLSSPLLLPASPHFPAMLSHPSPQHLLLLTNKKRWHPQPRFPSPPRNPAPNTVICQVRESRAPS